MIIWGTVLGLIVVAAALALRGFATSQDTQQQSDVQVYKDQMLGVEKDLQKGVVSQAQYQSLRGEIGRRLIAAAKKDKVATDTPGAGQVFVVGTVGGAALITALIYVQVGSPTLQDQPLTARFAASEDIRITRNTQEQAEAALPVFEAADVEYAALVSQLREALKTTPDNLGGHVMLVNEERKIGNFSGAYVAQAQVISLKGDTATAADHMLFAELQIAAANNYVSPTAEAALLQVLKLDPTNPLARYRVGQFFWQIERGDRTFVIWRDLLEQGPEQAPYIPRIRSSISELAAIAGVRYTPPPIAAVNIPNDTSGSELQVMASKLAAQLASQGGSAQDWARLIAAQSLLGNQAQAIAVFDEALQTFADRPDDIKTLTDAANAAGLSE